MRYAPKIHHRKSIRLPGYDYAGAGGYYVTLVTFRRDCLLGEIIDDEIHLSTLGKIAEECWQFIPEHFPNVELGEYVVMPNHIHGILIIHETVGATQWVAPTTTRPKGPTRGSLGAILGAYKMTVNRRADRELNFINIWQRNYYEHIIRDQPDWERIVSYILANPSQWAEDEENPSKNR